MQKTTRARGCSLRGLFVLKNVIIIVATNILTKKEEIMRTSIIKIGNSSGIIITKGVNV